jgi:hypothetical protein
VGKRKNNTLKGLDSANFRQEKASFKRNGKFLSWLNHEYGISVMLNDKLRKSLSEWSEIVTRQAEIEQARYSIIEKSGLKLSAFLKGLSATQKALNLPQILHAPASAINILSRVHAALLKAFISKLMECFVTSLAMEKQEAKEDAQEEANKPLCVCFYDTPVLAVAPVAKPYKSLR